MRQKEELLTRAEAIEQGYEYCGEKGVEWQSLQEIKHMDDTDFVHRDYCLFSKEEEGMNTDEKDLQDLIIDNLCSNFEFEDQSGDVERDLKRDVDWKLFVAQINASLDKHTWRRLTDINLVP